jgi:hypothetical protein
MDCMYCMYCVPYYTITILYYEYTTILWCTILYSIYYILLVYYTNLHTIYYILYTILMLLLCVSRYCAWIFEDEQMSDGTAQTRFVQLLEGLLHIILDTSPKVRTQIHTHYIDTHKHTHTYTLVGRHSTDTIRTTAGGVTTYYSRHESQGTHARTYAHTAYTYTAVAHHIIPRYGLPLVLPGVRLGLGLG